jgi:hypothetical protein
MYKMEAITENAKTEIINKIVKELEDKIYSYVDIDTYEIIMKGVSKKLYSSYIK